MPTIHLAKVLALGTLLALAACGGPDLGPGAASFGNSVRTNVVVQTVDPEPEEVATPPALEGNRAAIAIGRYQADKVEPPRELRTSNVGG